MVDLFGHQYLLIALAFIWSGFVRSGLGFGGVALSLPFLLLIENIPLVYLPILAIQLLFFSSITVFLSHKENKKNSLTLKHQSSTIDWHYLKTALCIMFIPKLLGVFGLITLPATLMSGIIFSIVLVYSFSYILQRPFTSKSKTLDCIFLILGGYASGVSLIGAPLVILVFASHVKKHQLRDTLFALWFILVTIKLAAFVLSNIDLQLIHQLWLLPCASIGHLLGLRVHKKLLTTDSNKFYRLLGSVLLMVSLIGLYNLIF